jgi:hypothetical protein
MARSRREITIEQAEALAARWEAEYKEHKRSVAITTRFQGVSPSEVVRMWKGGRNERGQKLSQFEFGALVERWVELFGA